MDIKSELGKLRRPRRLPARLEDGVIVSTVGERQQLMEASEYRCNVYYQVLDSFLAEMNSRFSDESTILMKAVQPCTPGSESFFNPDAIEPCCQFYDIDFTIKSEIEVAKNYISTQNLKKTAVALLDALPVNFFPHMSQMLRVIVTIPVSSATCERVNSCLKRIKNSKRSTMLNSRLSSLTVIAMNSDMLSTVDHNQIIDLFAQKQRRCELIIISLLFVFCFDIVYLFI